MTRSSECARRCAALLALVAYGAVMAAPAVVPNSSQFDLQSNDGRAYRVFVAAPLQPAPAAGYPVIYVLDGNSAFGTLVDTIRVQARFPEETGVPPAVVVAVGYPTAEPFDSERRVYDLTVPTPISMLPPRPDGKPRSPQAMGGADAFLEFILTEVKPRIQRDHRIDQKRQTLFGHSLGGLFVLHALFTRPDAFQAYVALSPSIWWKKRFVLEEERAWVRGLRATSALVRVFIAVGELEQQGEEPPDEGRMVGNARELSARLAVLADRTAQVQYYEVPGEHHRSIVPTATSRALRFALGSPDT